MNDQAKARVVFTLAIFFASFQLFLVQPMSAKLLLPRLGGSASVWTTCMIFFQATLLAGYLYAWFLQRRLTLRTQIIAHSVVTLATFGFLPFTLRTPPIESSSAPLLWILLTLAGTIGLPFFLTSTSSPLLQAWFARTDHPDAKDPYFLYAASNLGSMLALFGYLIVFEPQFALHTRTLIWASGHTIYAIMLAVIMFAFMWPIARRDTEPDAVVTEPEDGSQEDADEPDSELTAEGGAPLPTWSRLGLWTLYAAIPSSMLVGATHHLTVDVAPVPMLWVLPLAVYLGSFIVVFAKRQVLSAESWRTLGWLMLLPMTIFSALPHTSVVTVVAAIFGVFTTSVVFHGRMAELRPAAEHLTLFYAVMSFGGMLGGLFNGLFAPLVFDGFYEYYLVCMLAILAWPRSFYAELEAWPKWAFFGVGIYAIVASMFSLDATEALEWGDLPVFVGLIVAISILFSKKPILTHVFVAVIALLLMIPRFELNKDDDYLYTARSFYGPVKLRVGGPDKNLVLLKHGVTIHGAQMRGDLRPLGYYWSGGPSGDVLGSIASDADVAVIGLGVGALCGYYQKGQSFDFFEIDPLIIEVASNTEYFTFMNNCGEVDAFAGDGRIEIAKRPDASYDVIVLDAFSSDAIPTHLLTTEAAELYEAKLKPGGVLLFHIANRYLLLEKIVGLLAEERGLTARMRIDASWEKETMESTPSKWVALSKDPKALDALLEGKPDRNTLPAANDVNPWTDDHTNIFEIFQLQWFKQTREHTKTIDPDGATPSEQP